MHETYTYIYIYIYSITNIKIKTIHQQIASGTFISSLQTVEHREMKLVTHAYYHENYMFVNNNKELQEIFFKIFPSLLKLKTHRDETWYGKCIIPSAILL